jgi:hypothetical protein
MYNFLAESKAKSPIWLNIGLSVRRRTPRQLVYLPASSKMCHRHSDHFTEMEPEHCYTPPVGSDFAKSFDPRYIELSWKARFTWALAVYWGKHRETLPFISTYFLSVLFSFLFPFFCEPTHLQAILKDHWERMTANACHTYFDGIWGKCQPYLLFIPNSIFELDLKLV